MTPNLHVCTICFRPEVVYGVISSRNLRTIESNLGVTFDVASSNSFRDIEKKTFCDGGGGGGGGAADIDNSIKRKRIHISLKNESEVRFANSTRDQNNNIIYVM